MLTCWVIRQTKPKAPGSPPASPLCVTVREPEALREFACRIVHTHSPWDKNERVGGKQLKLYIIKICEIDV